MLNAGLSGTGKQTVTPQSSGGTPLDLSPEGLNAWSVASRNLRVSDVASVFDGAETQRVYSYVGGTMAITLGAQKTTGASEVAASDAVLAALPGLRARYPAVDFEVLNVQAKYTQQQIDAVWRTLAEGITFTGIVMLFFLRSWRNSVVVLIAIPSSLLVAFTIMKLANFTIDTVSLLAMTLIIGILVDDSIVVIENVERHYDDGEAPRTAAILGRSEIGAGGGRDHARRRRRVSADRVSARHHRTVPCRVRAGRRRRDADVAGRVVYDHAVTGRQLGVALAVETLADSRRIRRRLRALRDCFTRRA